MADDNRLTSHRRQRWKILTRAKRGIVSPNLPSKLSVRTELLRCARKKSLEWKRTSKKRDFGSEEGGSPYFSSLLTYYDLKSRGGSPAMKISGNSLNLMVSHSAQCETGPLK